MKVSHTKASIHRLTMVAGLSSSMSVPSLAQNFATLHSFDVVCEGTYPAAGVILSANTR